MAVCPWEGSIVEPDYGRKKKTNNTATSFLFFNLKCVFFFCFFYYALKKKGNLENNSSAPDVELVIFYAGLSFVFFSLCFSLPVSPRLQLTKRARKKNNKHQIGFHFFQIKKKPKPIPNIKKKRHWIGYTAIEDMILV